MKRKYGLADSKKLPDWRRLGIYKEIQECRGRDIGYFVHILTAEHLSNCMLADWDKGGMNLDKISYDVAVNLILKVKEQLGFKVKRVVLDMVGKE